MSHCPVQPNTQGECPSLCPVPDPNPGNNNCYCDITDTNQCKGKADGPHSCNTGPTQPGGKSTIVRGYCIGGLFQSGAFEGDKLNVNSVTKDENTYYDCNIGQQCAPCNSGKPFFDMYGVNKNVCVSDNIYKGFQAQAKPSKTANMGFMYSYDTKKYYPNQCTNDNTPCVSCTDNYTCKQ